MHGPQENLTIFFLFQSPHATHLVANWGNIAYEKGGDPGHKSRDEMNSHNQELIIFVSCELESRIGSWMR